MYIRRHYGVPAHRGQRVLYTARSDGEEFKGTIVSANQGRLRVKLDGAKRTSVFHPTYRLDYYAPDGKSFIWRSPVEEDDDE